MGMVRVGCCCSQLLRCLAAVVMQKTVLGENLPGNAGVIFSLMTML